MRNIYNFLENKNYKSFLNRLKQKWLKNTTH